MRTRRNPVHDSRVLRALFRAEGFVAGPPPGLPAAARAIDREACNAMLCPRCNRVGRPKVRLLYLPYHDAAGRYRVMAACPECAFAEEA